MRKVVRSAGRLLLVIGHWSLVIAVTAGVAVALEKPLSEAQGLQAPTDLPLLQAALADKRPVLLHFTGDAGPDNVHQVLVIEQLKSQFLGRVVFTEAVEKTPDGDKAFDAFGVKKIPSIVVLAPSGEIVAGFEGFATAGALETALHRAMVAGGGYRPAGLGQAGGATVQAGTLAPASTPAMETALASGQPVLLFFHAEWSRFSRDEASVVKSLAQDLTGEIQVVTLQDGASGDAKAIADYAVYGFPTLVVVGPNGRVQQVIRSTADRATLEGALTAAGH